MTSQMIGAWNQGLGALVIGEGAAVDTVIESLRASGAAVCRASHEAATDEFGVARVFDDAEHELGQPVGALIYAAPRTELETTVDDLPWQEWEKVIAADYHARFFGCAELARRSIAASRPAVILHLVSQAAVNGDRGAGAAAASAGGLDNLTKTLAVEWARDGIRSNTLVTGLLDATTDTEPDAKASLGHLSAYLCSDYASYITGTRVRVGE